MAEFGGPVDYIVDAVKLSFKALKVTTGARFAQVSLAVIPFLQELLDAMFSYEVARKSGPSGPPPTLGGNPEGEFQVHSMLGDLATLKGEGEPPAQLLQRVLAKLEAWERSSGNALPGRVRTVLKRAITLFKCMDAPPSFFELLVEVKGAMKGRYDQVVGQLLEHLDSDALQRMLTKLSTVITNVQDRVLAIDSLVSGIFRDRARRTQTIADFMKATDPEKLAELMSLMGRVTARLNGDAVLVGFALRSLIQSGVIRNADEAKEFFERVDNLIDDVSWDPTSMKGVRSALHRIGNTDAYNLVMGSVVQLDISRTLSKQVSEGNVPPELAGAVKVRLEVREPTGDWPTNKRGKAYKETQSVDVVYVDANNNVIGNVEVKTFNITRLNDTNNDGALNALRSQLLRYIKLKLLGQEFRYAVPDSDTAGRIIDAMTTKEQLAFRRAFGENIETLVSSNPKVYKYFNVVSSSFYR